MNTRLSRHHALLLVPCLAVALLAGPGVSFAEKRTSLVDFVEMAKLDQQVRSAMRIASKPEHLDLDGKEILWLTSQDMAREPGPLDYLKDAMARVFSNGEEGWTTKRVEDIKLWVARGHVLWVDTSLADKFGLNDSMAGSVGAAVPAEGAQGHPLLEGVARIECMDVFHYLRSLPSDAQPIMVAPNRAEHVVLAAWLLGKGLILFRPEPKLNVIDWTSSAHRDWIEPDLADGRRLLHNINLYTVEVLTKARNWPPRVCESSMTPLLEAFGATGPGKPTH